MAHGWFLWFQVGFHGFRSVLMVFHGSWLVFLGFRAVLLVFHGFRLVFHGSRLVFHGSRLVFMVMDGISWF